MEVNAFDIYLEHCEVYYNEWGGELDTEDGSTAPFTSLALEVACSRL